MCAHAPDPKVQHLASNLQFLVQYIADGPSQPCAVHVVEIADRMRADGRAVSLAAAAREFGAGL